MEGGVGGLEQSIVYPDGFQMMAEGGSHLLGLSHQATRIWAKLICCSLQIWLCIPLCTLGLI